MNENASPKPDMVRYTWNPSTPETGKEIRIWTQTELESKTLSKETDKQKHNPQIKRKNIDIKCNSSIKIQQIL